MLIFVSLQSEASSLGHEMEVYRARAEAFGFHAIVVDGHDVQALVNAFKEAENTKDKLTALVCKTLKGKIVVYSLVT